MRILWVYPHFQTDPNANIIVYMNHIVFYLYMYLFVYLLIYVFIKYIYIHINRIINHLYIYIPTVHLRPALLAPAGSGGTAAAAVPRPQRSPRSAAAPGRNTRSRPGGRGPWPRSPGPGAVSFGRDFCGEKYGKIPKRWENGHFVMDRNGALELGK